MQVSTKLFNQQAVNQFGKLTEEIQNLQAKVSTGKKYFKNHQTTLLRQLNYQQQKNKEIFLRDLKEMLTLLREGLT